MSTTKISDLPVLASADAADEFVVVDDSAGVTKKITQAGLADFGSNTLTAGGITFGADTLDDYEEGTWSPNLAGFENESNFVLEDANYLKVGNLVVCQIRFFFDLSATTDRIAIRADLPFATGNTDMPPGSAITSNGIYGSGDNQYGLVPVNDWTGGNDTQIGFAISEDDVRSSGNDKQIRGHFSYVIT